MNLGIKVMHVAERDTQVSPTIKQRDEFVNTWSIDGFVCEGAWQPAELGWGTHEKHFPKDGHHYSFGNNCAIYLDKPGCITRVRSWTPNEGPYHGFLVTHNESISTADYYSVFNGDRLVYRPTVHYAYHPCDDAVLSLHELAGRSFAQQTKQRLLLHDIESGMDELGILLMGHSKGAYWFGSQLTIEETRQLVPFQNATGLQVTAAVLGAMVWAMEHPNEGIVEAEQVDFQRVLEIAMPYLGPVKGYYTNWNPLQNRGLLFPEDIDSSDAWQFKNFRV